MGDTLLVTGGAGYIGSHTVWELLDNNYNVVVIDNLSKGYRASIPKDIPFYQVNVGAKEEIKKILKKHKIDGVIHFAASIEVEESIKNPLKYYNNNFIETKNLVEVLIDEKINNFIFSSTAAVYGSPKESKVSEETILNPINPYGWSKLFTEQMLKSLSDVTNFKTIILRYFNAAGSDVKGRTGQNYPNATHLIKVLSEFALNKRENFEIFGTDYDTPDGTCIRDYIHVTDLARIHILAYKKLKKENRTEVFNCGYGHGFSVKEIVKVMEDIINMKLKIKEGPRRKGDPAQLIADNSKMLKKLNFNSKYEDINLIVKTALDWEKNKTF